MPRKTYENLSYDRKEEFKNIVMELFINNEYKDIGIRDIAKATDISVGLFYKYFLDKDEMYLTFFSETEKKIIEKEKELKKTFFSLTPYIDISESLTSLEVEFNKSFYDAPRDVQLKFFYDGYANSMYTPIYEELVEMENSEKLNPNLDLDLIYHIIITSMFDFIQYVKSKNLTLEDDIVNLKKEYYVNMVFKGILSENFYNILKNNVKSNKNGMNFAKKFFPDVNKKMVSEN